MRTVTEKDKTMCRASMVLDTLKKTKTKGGMTSAQIKLAEAQAEDYAEMKEEIKSIKTEISDVKQEVCDVKVQLAEIKGSLKILLENSQIKVKLIDNKYFWIFLMLIILLFAGVTHISELKGLVGG